MKKHILLSILIIFAAFSASVAQDFQIDNTLVEYDGHRLSLTYDLNSRNQADIFFIIVEIIKSDGSAVKAKSFKGDIGARVSPGKAKSIIWIPEDDAIFLDDTVSLEIKAEKYERSFSRANVLFRSAVMPGLGQTKISQGKPWWLTGIAAYGSLAGGFVFRNNYQRNYDLYILETDPLERADLFDQSQSDKQLSNIMFASAAVIWVGNLIWAAAAPNEEKEIGLKKFAIKVSPVPGTRGIIAGLSFTLDF